MNMFPTTVAPDNVLSDRFRVHLVIGDGMAPSLRSNYDYVILKPTEEWCGEGIYLMHNGVGPDLYRLQSWGGGKLLMKHDNPIYDAHHVLTLDQFRENVLGYVVADIKVRDERAIREAAR